MVHYLAENGFKVIIASRTLAKAQELAKGHQNIEPRQLDIESPDGLDRLAEIVPEVDGVVSMLPYLFHAAAAKVAIANKKHFFTTSYISPAIRALEESAKDAGVMLLNECGVDPGFDHMSALRVIHDVQAKGGKIVSFTSTTGGLPAPDPKFPPNPFGYKFSWAPRGVLLAGLNASRFLEEGVEISTKAGELFNHYRVETVPELNGGTVVEVLPNRDSIPYIQSYSIEGVNTMFRGTYRNRGWCPTLRVIISLGLCSLEERTFDADYTFAQLVREKLGESESDLRTALLAFVTSLGKASVENDFPDSDAANPDVVVSRIEWLGLLSDEKIPQGTKTTLDAVCHLMQTRMKYETGERDMILMRHTFVAEYEGGKRENISATLIDFGIEQGDSSMSRTVGLPLAVAIKLLYSGKIAFRSGVWAPVYPEIYNGILPELETLGIKIIESRN